MTVIDVKIAGRCTAANLTAAPYTLNPGVVLLEREVVELFELMTASRYNPPLRVRFFVATMPRVHLLPVLCVPRTDASRLAYTAPRITPIAHTRTATKVVE